jgi:hypothetical protein
MTYELIPDDFKRRVAEARGIYDPISRSEALDALRSEFMETRVYLAELSRDLDYFEGRALQRIAAQRGGEDPLATYLALPVHEEIDRILATAHDVARLWLLEHDDDEVIGSRLRTALDTLAELLGETDEPDFHEPTSGEDALSDLQVERDREAREDRADAIRDDEQYGSPEDR